MIRVLVVDDHPVVRSGLVTLLEAAEDIEIVAAVADGADAIRLAGRERPDLVLMDLRMEDVDGVAATAYIREHHPECHVLVLTTYETDAAILRAIEAGATGYLLKDASRDELLAAVRSAAAGETTLAPRVASRLVDRVRGGTVDALTPREIEVLELVADGSSNAEIAAALHVSDATVKTHLLHVFDKLGVRTRTAAVTRAAQLGIIGLGGEADRTGP